MIAWIAFCLSLTGVILNAKKIIYCWPIWTLSNFFWIYHTIYVQEWAALTTWSLFLLANVYGWIQWNKEKKSLSKDGGWADKD